jgi:hypothetical protein
MANFLSAQADSGRRIRILATSLGNMVVNSALTRGQYEAKDVLSKGAITSFVMNEAAVPAEAFTSAYYSQNSNGGLENQAAAIDGFSNDSGWQAQWSDMLKNRTDLLDQWENTLADPNYVTQPLPEYDLRWTQQRPSAGVPDNDPGATTPQRGPWLGFFALSPELLSSMTNSYSANDGVLSTNANVLSGVWVMAQLLQEPNLAANYGLTAALGSTTPDNETQQFWAQTTHTDGEDEILWGQACSTPSTCQHSNILRQWSELAYWFPAVENAAGSQNVAGAVTLNPLDLTTYAPSSLGVLQSHSYLTLQPYFSVYGAWQEIHNAMH